MTVKNEGNLHNSPNLYSGLSTDTKPSHPKLKSEFVETDTNIWSRFHGSGWSEFSRPAPDNNDAELVVSYSPYFGADKSREYIGAAAARQKFTWPAGTGPKKIFIRAYTAAVSANLPLEAINCCFDAESDAVADANLAGTGGVAVDMQSEIVQVADGWYEKTFAVPLERMDFIVETGTISAIRVRGV